MNKRTEIKSLISIEYVYYSSRGNWDRELMKRLAQRGYNVHAIARPFPERFRYEEKELHSLGVKLHFVKWRNKLLFALTSLFIFCDIAYHTPSILYTASIRLIPFYYPFARILRVPILFSLQGAALRELEIFPRYEELRKHKIRYWLKRTARKWYEKTSARLAKRTIVISKAILDELYQLGEGKKATLIHYCVDKEQFCSQASRREELRRRCGISNREVVVTFVGMLTFEVPVRLQQAEMLIEVVKDMDMPLKALIIGEGNAVEYLRGMVKQEGLEDKVILTGFVPHLSLPEYLSASDIFFFVLTEPIPTYGLALLEAMSCGLAVLTSNSDTQREIIIEGVNGFLVEPEIEQIKRKLRDIIALKEDELNRIKQRARRDVEEKYCWEVIVPKIEGIILKTIK